MKEKVKQDKRKQCIKQERKQRGLEKIEVLINRALSAAIASVGFPSLPCGRNNRKISQPGFKKKKKT